MTTNVQQCLKSTLVLYHFVHVPKHQLVTLPQSHTVRLDDVHMYSLSGNGITLMLLTDLNELT